MPTSRRGFAVSTRNLPEQCPDRMNIGLVGCGRWGRFILRDLLSRQLTHYRKETKAASELLQVGESKVDDKLDQSELAAWTMVASAILNLDETVTKE